MTQISIQDLKKKKKNQAFFRSIAILESPQLGIVKEIKSMICTIVLKRPKNKSFVRDFFLHRKRKGSLMDIQTH